MVVVVWGVALNTASKEVDNFVGKLECGFV